MSRSVVCVEIPDFMLSTLAKIAAEEGDELLVITRDAQARENYDVLDIDVRGDPGLVASQVRERAGQPIAVLTTQEMFLTQAARLAEALGVLRNSRASIEICRDKAQMKHAWQAAGVRTPRGGFFRSLKEIDLSEAAFDYPVIVKPSLGYASCGVRRVSSPEELGKQLRKISLINSTMVANEGLTGAGFIVEEFLDGPEYAVDTVWFQGEPVFDGVLSRGADMPGPYYPDRLYSVDPQSGQSRRSRVIALAHEAVRAVGINYGATHTEIRFSGPLPYVLETASRPGANGIFYELLQQAHGVDFSRAYYLAHVCRDREEFHARLGRQQWSDPPAGLSYFWYHIPHRGSGVIKEINGLDELRGRPEVLMCICYKKPGGILYPEVDLNSEYFCSVVGGYSPGADGPALEEYVKQYDESLDVVF